MTPSPNPAATITDAKLGEAENLALDKIEWALSQLRNFAAERQRRATSNITPLLEAQAQASIEKKGGTP